MHYRSISQVHKLWPLIIHWTKGFIVMNRKQTPPAPKEAEICLTPACVLAASEILENMSPRYHDIDPCTNFDKFVCEGWAEKHDLRADQGGAFTGTIMAENAQMILRHVLESPYPVDNQVIEVHSAAKQKIFEKLHDAYDACMDEEAIRGMGSAPLLDVLRKVEELFPAARPYDDVTTFPGFKEVDQKGLSFVDDSRLTKTVAYLTSIGVNALISCYVGVRLVKSILRTPAAKVTSLGR